MTQNFKYLTLLFGSSMGICLIVFCINIFFDPLWYINGNQFEGLNYMFDERLSKTNQYLKRRSSHAYNCIIFGSSRTTLLNESQLGDPYRCFNFSFSGGRIKEFIAFAKWLKNKGEHPDYVILGIDDFNFVELDKALNIPNFIKNNSDPPSVFYSYFSLDALDMSFSLFFHAKNWPKIYDHEFLGAVVQNPPQYIPKLRPSHGKHRIDVINNYKEFRDIFPQAMFIGYIPPISSWETASKPPSQLEFFLHSIYTISNFFDEFYDFSVPSAVTGNPKNTYDGGHYYPFIQKEIVRRITGKPAAFGLAVKMFSREQYIETYRTKVREFKTSLIPS
jgi:hypothetical protein